MQIKKTSLPGVVEIFPDVFGDERGFFYESWQRHRYQSRGMSGDFVQDNISKSKKGVLRGLHFQNPKHQGKLVTVLVGVVFDVAVDIRLGSPSFGQWVAVKLDSEKKNQLYIPSGFAHGFEVISETALFSYKCTEIYAPQYEKCIRYDDPDINIGWNTSLPSLSEKDRRAPFLKEIPKSDLPRFKTV